MELDPHQGDLFLNLINGDKKDTYPSYRSKIDALETKSSGSFDQEGNLVQSQETMVNSSK